jgi:hypothetical protein
MPRYSDRANSAYKLSVVNLIINIILIIIMLLNF